MKPQPVYVLFECGMSLDSGDYAEILELKRFKRYYKKHHDDDPAARFYITEIYRSKNLNKVKEEQKIYNMSVFFHALINQMFDFNRHLVDFINTDLYFKYIAKCIINKRR